MNYYLGCRNLHFLVGPLGGARNLSRSTAEVLKQMGLVWTDVGRLERVVFTSLRIWLAFWGFSQEGLLWSLYMDDPGLMCGEDVTDDIMRGTGTGRSQLHISPKQCWVKWQWLPKEMSDAIIKPDKWLMHFKRKKKRKKKQKCFFFFFGWGTHQKHRTGITVRTCNWTSELGAKFPVVWRWRTHTQMRFSPSTCDERWRNVQTAGKFNGPVKHFISSRDCGCVTLSEQPVKPLRSVWNVLHWYSDFPLPTLSV